MILSITPHLDNFITSGTGADQEKIAIDGIIEVTTVLNSTITSSPLENGTIYSDAINNNPTKMIISVYISDLQPISLYSLAQIATGKLKYSVNRSYEAINKIYEFHTTKKVVDVQTKNFRFINAAIKNVELPETRAKGAKIILELEEITGLSSLLQNTKSKRHNILQHFK